METRAVVRSPAALGRELARLRYDRGLTQAELAESLGVSRRFVYELEVGKPNLWPVRLFEVLRELGARVEVVADLPDEQPNGRTDAAASPESGREPA